MQSTNWREINKRIAECRGLRDQAKVVSSLEELFREKNDGMVALALGQEHEKNGRIEEAVRYYEKAEALFPLPDYKRQARESIDRLKANDEKNAVVLSAERAPYLVSKSPSAKVPEDEKDFRKRYRADIQCEDGHKVRSRGEALIDNWLYHQYIPHAYERRLPIPDEVVYSDFFVRTPEGECYIEYFGLEDAEYAERAKRKREIYRKEGLNVVEITNEDLNGLDDVLPARLGKFLKGHKFR